jgi:helicase conserved C-domain protein
MIQELIKKVRIDSYFIELFNKAEEFNISKFFSLDNDIAFTEKEYVDLLRFSDLLSHSDDVYDRNLSYKILSLLYDYYDFKDIFDYYSIPILSKL